MKIVAKSYYPNIHRPKSVRPESWMLHKDKKGLGWLIPDNGDTSHIYCTNSANWDKPGEGFGGSTIVYPLVGGGDFELRGGWCRSAHDLYKHTGFDLRANTLHQAYVFRKFTYHSGEPYPKNLEIHDVYYMNTEPVIGDTDQCNWVAAAVILDNPDLTLFTYLQTCGGSSRSITKDYEWAQKFTPEEIQCGRDLLEGNPLSEKVVPRPPAWPQLI